MVNLRCPSWQFSFQEALRVFIDGLFIEFAYMIGLELFFRVIIHHCWHLEWIYVEVLEPLWVTSHVHPGVVDWHNFSLVVKSVQDCFVLLEIFKFVVDLSHSWDETDRTSFPVVQTPILEILV